MSLTVHHLNCATLCPVGNQLLMGKTGRSDNPHLVCHCLLVETDQGLVLVDTGLGYRDILHTTLTDGLFPLLTRPSFNPEETAIEQIQSLGFKANEVEHIILTHLDPDHAGGIADFPKATVHLLDRELAAAEQPKTLTERRRYQPKQWAHTPNWKAHTITTETWYGFERITVLQDNLTEILLIPLTGHTRGHCGVAVSTPQGWILHAGDLYLRRTELEPSLNSKRPSKRDRSLLHLFHKISDSNNHERQHNLDKLRQLYLDDTHNIEIICSHDPDEFMSCKKCQTYPTEPIA